MFVIDKQVFTPHLISKDSDIIYVRSSSMSLQDHQPLLDTPVTQQIAQHNNNRLGAVYHALYSFWSARNAVFRNIGQRPDAYSVVLFDRSVHPILINDQESTPEELLQCIVEHRTGRGTHFGTVLDEIVSLMRLHWTPERYIELQVL